MRGRRISVRSGRLLHSAVGFLIGAACLVWVFHDVELRPMFEAARTLRWDFVALAIVCDILSFVAQGIRWKLLLAPVGTALSLALLICQMVSFWLAMIAYRLDVAFWTAAIILIIVRFGTVVPGAPANVGTYQFFCVLGLTLFGVDKTRATGFSVVVFLLLTVPLWVLGAVSVSRTGAGIAFRARRG
jgi:uncharacterized membrane protein YbhN (UPF0104 family)